MSWFSDLFSRKKKPTPAPKPPVTPPPVPVPSSMIVQAVSTDSFLVTLGVNTHFNFGMNDKKNAYANLSTIETQLSYIGIKDCRDTMAQIGGKRPVTVMRQLKKDMPDILFDIIVDGDQSLYAQQVADIKANSDLLGAIEGPNEIDNWPVTWDGQKGAAGALACQKKIYSDLDSQAVAMVNLSIADSTKITAPLKNMDAYCDYFNTHIYTMWGGNSNLAGAISWSINSDRPMAPKRRPVCTEFGWWTQPGKNGVTEAVQAKYALNFYFEAFRAGCAAAYLYELNDEYPDPSGADPEKHYGLFKADGTPKKAAQAIHNLTAALAGGGAVSPGTLSFGLSNSNIRQLLMQRSDGVFILALWQDLCLWDNAAHKEITESNLPVTVTFGTPVKNVSMMDLMPGSSGSAIGNVTNFFTMVPDHPVLLFITP